MTSEGSASRSAAPAAPSLENLRIVTTSWDDGDPRDIKVADLLSSRGLPGTFYVPIKGYQGSQTLSAVQLRALSSAGFEIGAHSVSHRSLSHLPPSELRDEVWNCKEMLQEALGRSVLMFCYPNGRYNARVIREVKRAGYVGARTTRMLTTKPYFPRFEMPTAVQAFPHPKRRYLRNLGRALNVQGMVQYVAKWSWCKDWADLGKELFRRVLKSGGIWHLYGHSWEIDALKIWPDLQEMLDYVSGRKEVTYVTNGQLVQLLRDAAGHKATEDA